MSSKLSALPSSTVRLLGSSQVITSVYSVVKELLENALDAGASSVDVKLEDFGLGKIEVRDNGHGIKGVDVPFIAKRYHTTKISQFSDLQTLTTYGFRGEALGSLCTVCSLSITTKTSSDDISLTYNFNNQGQITGTNPSHLLQGTTITVSEIFKNLPVRRTYYNTAKRKKEELKKIEDLLVSYAVICPGLRLTLRHNKGIIWQRSPVTNHHQAVAALGRDVVNSLVYREATNQHITLKIFVPKPESADTIKSRSSKDRCMTFINKRPVINKEIDKMMSQFCDCPSGKWPFYIAMIDLPPGEIDVNIEPNKTQIYLQNKDMVMEMLKKELEEVYGEINKLSTKAKGISRDNESDHQQDDGQGHFTQDDTLSDMSTSQCTDTQSGKIKITPQSSFDLDPHLLKVKILTDSTDADIIQSNSVPLKSHSNKNNGKISEKVDYLSTQDEQCCFDIVGEEFREIIDLDSSSSPVLNGQDADIPGKNCNKDERCHSEKDGYDTRDRTLLTSGKNLEKYTESNESRNGVMGEDSILEVLENWDDNNPNMTDDLLAGCEDMRSMKSMSEKESVDSDTVNIDDTTDHLLADLSADQTVGQETLGDERLDSALGREDAIEWSKGQGLKSSTGEVIQPVSLLNAKKRPRSPSEESPSKQRRSLPDCSKMGTDLNDGENSTGTAPFELFAKSITPTVVREFPSSDVQRISQIVQEKWSALTPGERTNFHLKAGANNTPQQKSTKSLNRLRNKMKKQNRSPNQPASISIKERLMLSSDKQSTVQTKQIPFSVRKLQELFSGRIIQSQEETSDTLQLIAPLKSCGVWLCIHSNQISLLNPHRVQEMMIFHNLMSNHILPTKKLDTPISISQSSLGPMLWTKLQTLARQYMTDQPFCLLADDRFISNGIKLQIHLDNSLDEVCCNLTELCPLIPMYGVKDLKEILDIIENSSAENLEKARPLKVLNYLQGEAVRMARKLPQQIIKEDVESIATEMQNLLSKNCQSCFHGRQFLHSLFNLVDLPLSQNL